MYVYSQYPTYSFIKNLLSEVNNAIRDVVHNVHMYTL